MSFSRSRLPVWLHTLLVAALLWAPLWGHLHNIGHGIEHGRDHGTLQAISAPDGLDEAHAGPAHDEHRHEGHSDALGHEVDADLCRVLDHLSQAERLSATCSPGLAPRVAMVPPIFRVAFSPDQDLWSSAQARAPPVLI
ncbi:DUF2946 family protein [Limnohabitans sp. 2KL-51]|jgi:hypothetical protein|uniref:DUF2946 family protein n=1 Tax=Limnohabitans sp. 2KL-51 TaxID=1977911 RepID=UPI000D3929A8|nr:DUF2946 family protein [Limnohabitans sp. 2KL-51]PUE47786.1 hypothetical protein B9Z49_10590 [Limnohabitans sp. 2KL-51]